jgi:hypothetical protein
MSTFDQWWIASMGDDSYTHLLDGIKPYFQRAFDAGAGAAGKAIDDLVKARALAREAVREDVHVLEPADEGEPELELREGAIERRDAAVAKLLALLTT